MVGAAGHHPYRAGSAGRARGSSITRSHAVPASQLDHQARLRTEADGQHEDPWNIGHPLVLHMPSATQRREDDQVEQREGRRGDDPNGDGSPCKRGWGDGGRLSSDSVGKDP